MTSERTALAGTELLSLGHTSHARPRRGLMGSLTTTSLPWLLANQMRPIAPLPEPRLTYAAPSVFAVPRDRQYFGEDVGAVYLRVLGELAASTCWELGVVGGQETRVYPLFRFARARGLPFRVYYLEVTNDTRVLELRPPLCAVLVREEQPPGWRPGPSHQHLRHRWSDGRFALYRAPDSGALASRARMVP